MRHATFAAGIDPKTIAACAAWNRPAFGSVFVPDLLVQ
jgi:hypothetical protein